MVQYIVGFPFPKQGQPLYTGQQLELPEQQVQWYRLDQRVSPVIIYAEDFEPPAYAIGAEIFAEGFDA